MEAPSLPKTANQQTDRLQKALQKLDSTFDSSACIYEQSRPVAEAARGTDIPKLLNEFGRKCNKNRSGDFSVIPDRYGTTVIRAMKIFEGKNIHASIRIANGAQATANIRRSWNSVLIALAGSYTSKTVRVDNQSFEVTGTEEHIRSALPSELCLSSTRIKAVPRKSDTTRVVVIEQDNEPLMQKTCEFMKTNMGMTPRTYFHCSAPIKTDGSFDKRRVQNFPGKLFPCFTMETRPFSPIVHAAGSLHTLKANSGEGTIDLLIEIVDTMEKKTFIHFNKFKRAPYLPNEMKEKFKDISLRLQFEEREKSGFRMAMVRQMPEEEDEIPKLLPEPPSLPVMPASRKQVDTRPLYIEFQERLAFIHERVQGRRKNRLWPRDKAHIENVGRSLAKYITNGGFLDRTKKVDVVRAYDKSVVMWRYYLVEEAPKDDDGNSGVIVRLHLFPNATETYLHNHKNNFVSFCLGGSYLHRTWSSSPSKNSEYMIQLRQNDGNLTGGRIVKGCLTNLDCYMHSFNTAYFIASMTHHTVSVPSHEQKQHQNSQYPRRSKTLSFFVKDTEMGSHTAVLTPGGPEGKAVIKGLNHGGTDTELKSPEKGDVISAIEGILQAMGKRLNL